jgi:DNA-damage-inducible protein J
MANFLEEKEKKNKNEVIQVRVQKPVKDKVENILERLGLNTSQAVNIFFKKIIDKNGLPFDLVVEKERFELTRDEIVLIRENRARYARGEGVELDVMNDEELDAFLDGKPKQK